MADTMRSRADVLAGATGVGCLRLQTVSGRAWSRYR
jgi:hypothetical protein